MAAGWKRKKRAVVVSNANGRHTVLKTFSQITFRIEESEYVKILQLADVNQVTIAEQARRLCALALKKQEG